LRGTLRLVRIDILDAQPARNLSFVRPQGLKPIASFALIGTAKALS